MQNRLSSPKITSSGDGSASEQLASWAHGYLTAQRPAKCLRRFLPDHLFLWVWEEPPSMSGNADLPRLLSNSLSLSLPLSVTNPLENNPSTDLAHLTDPPSVSVSKSDPRLYRSF